MFYTYILYSQKTDGYYVGYTNNVTERLSKHNAQHKGFTSQASDWQIVYHEAFSIKADAMAREKQIKSWNSRKMIEHLI